jgi:hypothetical protein
MTPTCVGGHEGDGGGVERVQQVELLWNVEESRIVRE